LKNSIRPEGYLLSVTINPNVNASLYIDAPAVVNNVDWLNLNFFDVQTPERNKKEADFSAPIYAPSERDKELNVDFQVTNLITLGFPANKIIVGIPTHGRTWKIEEGSTSTGVPPVTADGPAPEGIQSHKEGLLSYPEICGKLLNPQNKDLKGENGPIRKVGDPTKRFGSYGYRLPDSSGKHGLWVSFEDTDSAGNKAEYAKKKGLAGVAVHDLTMDDFRGACTGDKFPILKAARLRFM
jgi:chitinase